MPPFFPLVHSEFALGQGNQFVAMPLSFLLAHLFFDYPFIKGSSLEPQTTRMSRCQEICCSLVLSYKDILDSLRQYFCLCLRFIPRGPPLLGHVSLFWHLFAISSTRTSLFFHPFMFQRHESLAGHLLRSSQTLHIEWSHISWIFS